MKTTKEMQNQYPKHIAFIMDGNGRWAEKRGYNRNIGHRQGAKALVNLIRRVNELGISYMTVYAFSTENWRRPQKEVDFLMKLPIEFFKQNQNKFRDEQICVKVIGDTLPLPQELREKILEVEEQTKEYKQLTLLIALNYGSRDEIVRATKNIAEKAEKGELSSSSIDEKMFGDFLYTAGVPDVDLLIRTSGETRISNFLLWQISYSEIYFTDVLWPDFRKKHLDEALHFYMNRQRRFGGVS